VLYLAHLVERKGYQDLIQAFAGVCRTDSGARLIFCGSGDVERARQMCDTHGILERVDFHGWVSETQKLEQLAKAMVFCLPSYDEGLPMGVLEAMSLGVPIVTTPVGGIPDVLRHEENALIVEPGDAEDLGRQISRLLSDAELRRTLASKALEESVRLRPERIADQWIDLYLQVAGRGPCKTQSGTKMSDRQT